MKLKYVVNVVHTACAKLECIINLLNFYSTVHIFR